MSFEKHISGGFFFFSSKGNGKELPCNQKHCKETLQKEAVEQLRPAFIFLGKSPFSVAFAFPSYG